MGSRDLTFRQQMFVSSCCRNPLAEKGAGNRDGAQGRVIKGAEEQESLASSEVDLCLPEASVAGADVLGEGAFFPEE